MAKGIAAKTPPKPLGKAFFSKLDHSKEGKLAPAKIRSSITAMIVMINSKEAAALTP